MTQVDQRRAFYFGTYRQAGHYWWTTRLKQMHSGHSGEFEVQPWGRYVDGKLNRRFVGVELNPEYAGMASRRIANDRPKETKPMKLLGAEQVSLFAAVHVQSSRDNES
jgi:hypothetical protein